MGWTSSAPIADMFEVESINAWARRTADRCERRLVDLVKGFTPVAEPHPDDERDGREPGDLRDSWESEVDVFSQDHFRVTVFTRDRIAPHVEYPTRPHIIRPRTASVLRFWAGGQLIFAREVMHPGTQGAFMLHKALDVMRAEWRVIAREELARISARVN